jgi:RNA polymerase sigma factor (sigma-70 family)
MGGTTYLTEYHTEHGRRDVESVSTRVFTHHAKGQAMFRNKYPGIVEPSVADLIVRRARRMRLNRHDIDDLQQQIVPALVNFRFDPARANGASPSTVMTGVIDRQIKAHLRCEIRYQQRLERLRIMLGGSEDVRTSDRVPCSAPEPVGLRMDVQATMAGLSCRERDICQALSEGLAVTTIAQQLGCGRDTVDRACARIRRRFAAAGLEAWISGVRA